jgi:opacity protein-like surface antigen
MQRISPMPEARYFALCLSLGLAALACPLAQAGDWSYELNSNYSFVGGAKTDLGQFKGVKNGDVSEQSSLFHFVASPQLAEGVLLRLGTEWQRYSFGLPASAPLPNTLQSTSLVLGMDVQAFGSWLFRVETTPGFYSASNRFDGNDFNMPFILGGSYIASPDLQWVLGLEVDVHNRYPVLPGAGVRWKFAEKWVMNAVLPNPRLEYSFSKSLMLYTGMDFRMGTYRMDDRFGAAHGARVLNDAIVEYTELRAGCGASWKLSHAITLELEGGYMPYRDFNYHRHDDSATTLNGAPYGQISIGGRF